MTKRERTIAIVLGVAAGAYALDSLLITPQLEARTLLKDQVEVARRELEADRYLISRKPFLDAAWRDNVNKGLVTDPLDATGRVAGFLNAEADRQELTIGPLTSNRSPQPVNKPGGKTGEKEPGFMRVSCQFTVTGRMAQIANFLQNIQNAEIPVRISDIRITTKEEGTDFQEMALTVSTIILRSDQPGSLGNTRPPSTQTTAAGPSTSPNSSTRRQ